MTTLALFALLSSPAAAFDAPQAAQAVMTVQGTPLRLTATRPLAFAPATQPLETQPFVQVDPDHAFQALVGIGGALTDAAVDALSTLPKAKQAEVIKAFYDPKEGLGYSLARTNIHSCDFSSATYTYAAEGDVPLKTFSIAHDLERRIPVIKQAIAAAGGTLTLFASPWSPPAWMKDNGDMLHGGKLKPEFRQAWADYFVKFIRAYEKEGVPVWGVTVQNEPMAAQKWESCLYTAEEERDFLKDFLGPTLAKAGLGAKKVMVWDHNRDLMYQRAAVIFSDPEAAKYAWGLAYHWYEDWSGGLPMHDNVRRVAEAFPDKAVFFSEGCSCPYDPVKADAWSLGELYARQMIRDFNAGTAAWTDWNVMLDSEGGPNHVRNFCFAPLHIDAKTGALNYTAIYPYFGHFSKFIRPGARRVAVAPSRDALQSTAFLNVDGTLAVVVMNESDKAMPFSLLVKGRAAPAEAPAHSIATYLVR